MQLLDESTEEVLDPRPRETQPFSQFCENLIEEGAVFVRALHD